MQNYTYIVPGEPLRRGLNLRGVAKYSDVGHVEGYISETVQDTASGTIKDYRKSYPWNLMVLICWPILGNVISATVALVCINLQPEYELQSSTRFGQFQKFERFQLGHPPLQPPLRKKNLHRV